MKTRIQNLFITLALLAGIHQAAAQGTTAFTYQGQLHDGGTNANGTYTMIFKLYDASTSGNQIGSTITTSPTLANGLFTVNLDFGVGAFNGSARWLDITVTNGGTSQELSPRVQMLPAPYAQFAAVAATVTNGAIMNAQIAANAVNTTNIQNNAITTNQIASGQVVKSLNGLKDFVSLAAGVNVTLTTNGQTLTIAGTGGSSGGINYIPNLTYFQTNGTFIVPTNVTRVMVEVWGGGGGGGAGYYINGNFYNGYGGAGGGYSKGVFNVTSGTNYTVIVGSGGDPSNNGGNSSFGNLISATGGETGVTGEEIYNGPSSIAIGGHGTGGQISIQGGSNDADPSGSGSPNGGFGGVLNYDNDGDGQNGGSPGGGGGGDGVSTIGIAGQGGTGLVIIYY